MKILIQSFLLFLSFLISTGCGAEQGMTESTEDSSGVARVFISTGGLYTKGRGYEGLKTDKPLEYYESKLTEAHSLDDKIDALNNLGIAYHAIGEYGKAEEAYQQALSITRSAGDYATIYNNLGMNYASLGSNGNAFRYLNKALDYTEKQSHPDKRGKGVILNNLGSIYQSQKQFDYAISTYLEALDLLELESNFENQKGQEIVLSNLGGAYRSLRNFDKAEIYFQKALEIARESNNRPAEAKILNNIGSTYRVKGGPKKAIKAFQQALAIKLEINDRAGEAITLNNLMFSYKDIRKFNLAVFFGKQAVNAYQEIRSGLQNLDKQTQLEYLSSIQDSYRALSDLLIATGRLSEAEQVLKLLKIEEYINYVQRNQNETSLLTQAADLTPTEAKWNRRYQKTDDQLTALGIEYETLKGKYPRTAAEEQRITQLWKEIKVANTAFISFLDSLKSDNSISEDKSMELRESQGLMETLGELGNGAVALYTLIRDDTYRVMLVTPTVRKAAEFRIKSTELNDKVERFRQAMKDPSKDPKPLAQELYRVLIGPIAKDLKRAGAKTLMWSLDGTLRLLPMNALHDGKQYFIESYRNVVFTLASQSRLKDKPTAQWRGLGLGVSKAHKPEFDELPGVATELNEIIHEQMDTDVAGVMPGIIILDETFTAVNMITALQAGYPLVHIASHFKLKPGNVADSFLLLGDGSHLSLKEIETLPNMFSGVDLLTLSACDTAMGGSSADGNEVEGFSVLAQRQGAKSVIATLWPVADESTCLLMHKFYYERQHNVGMLKLEALRQAQLSLLNGKEVKCVTSSSSERGKSLPGAVAKLDNMHAFSHPYYWAPFVLTGNWL